MKTPIYVISSTDQTKTQSIIHSLVHEEFKDEPAAYVTEQVHRLVALTDEEILTKRPTDSDVSTLSYLDLLTKALREPMMVLRLRPSALIVYNMDTLDTETRKIFSNEEIVTIARGGNPLFLGSSSSNLVEELRDVITEKDQVEVIHIGE